MATTERKIVKVKMFTEVCIDVSADWETSDIEFWLNESSWCANNILRELEKQYEGKDKSCMCGTTTFEVIE